MYGDIYLSSKFLSVILVHNFWTLSFSNLQVLFEVSNSIRQKLIWREILGLGNVFLLREEKNFEETGSEMWTNTVYSFSIACSLFAQCHVLRSFSKNFSTRVFWKPRWSRKSCEILQGVLDQN